MDKEKEIELQKESTETKVVKEIFDIIDKMYIQADANIPDSEYKVGKLDALCDVLNIFCNRFGFEVTEC